MNAEDLLLSLFKDDREYARKHAELRARLSSVMIAIAAGTLALIVSDVGEAGTDRNFALIVVIIGIFGFFFQLKYAASERLHLNRAHEYFKALCEISKKFAVAIDIVELKDKGTNATLRSGYRYLGMHYFHMYWFWSALYLLVILIGVYLFTTLPPDS